MSALFNLGTGGMIAQSEQMAAIGNNIANSQTTGYKRSSMSFLEAFCTSQGVSPSGSRNQVGGGVTIASETDWNNGVTEETGEEANIAIVGDGFLPVQTPGATAIHYTRAGDFNIIEDPTTPGQYLMMRPDGSALYGGSIDGGTGQFTLDGLVTFTEYPNSIMIGGDGSITAYKPDGTAFTGAELLNGNIGLVVFRYPDALIKTSAGLYSATTEADRATDAVSSDAFSPGSDGVGSIRQGALEMSNVDLVEEFSDMIVTQRAFQASSKVVMTGDQMIQELLNMKR